MNFSRQYFKNKIESISSIDLIEHNLYLGGLTAAKDINVLYKFKITHILTIDKWPLPEKILTLPHLTTKFIKLSDKPQQNLLEYFDETYSFIKKGLINGVVLVHCHVGVSRSAAVLIAYLMKKDRISYSEAFDIVKAKRSPIEPNEGFISQLILYKEMGYTLDRDSEAYKYFISRADKLRTKKRNSYSSYEDEKSRNKLCDKM